MNPTTEEVACRHVEAARAEMISTQAMFKLETNLKPLCTSVPAKLAYTRVERYMNRLIHVLTNESNTTYHALVKRANKEKK